MLVSRYFPTFEYSMWPCVVLLAVFVPLSVWHERNWRRTLATYARIRRDAGFVDGEWPSADLRVVLGAQPWLLFSAAGLLGAFVAWTLWAMLQWPHVPAGFDNVLNFYDLPFLWAMVVVAVAAMVAVVAIGVDAARSPWATVADCVRRAMYASADRRAELLARALGSDPGERTAAMPVPGAPHVFSTQSRART